MESEIRKLKSIRGAGIYILISLLFFIVMVIVTLVQGVSLFTATEEITAAQGTSIFICWIFLLLSVILLAIGGLTNFITSLVILCTSWKSNWARKHKVLWGILSLFILLFIGIIVFGAVGVNTAREEEKRSYNNDYGQYPQYNNPYNPYQPRDPWNNGNY